MKMAKEYHYDVVILGAGPAGLTAGIYSARYNLDTLIISRDIGGMANLAPKIENYPGFEGSGAELMKKFAEQAKKHGVKFLDEEISDIEKDDNGFVIITKKEKKIHTKTIIFSLGTEKRKLNIPGENNLLGKGVSYCATCDGFFFKNKAVIVVGGSDSAAHASLELANYAKDVKIVYRGEKLRCEKINLERIKKNNKIEIVYNAIPLEVKGKNKVEAFVVDIKGKIIEIKTDGIFIEIGAIPSTELAKKLCVDLEEDYIKVNHDLETNVQGIFAAGDAVKSKIKQVILSAAQGALAAKSAHEYLIKNE